MADRVSTPRERRDVIKALGAGALSLGVAGCLGGESDGGDGGSGDGGSGDDGGQSTPMPQSFEVWAWNPHPPHLQTAGELFNEQSSHTVTGVEKSGLAELWTTGLQSQSGLPPLALIRQWVLSGAARNDGLVKTQDVVSKYDDGLFTISKTLNRVDGEFYNFPSDTGPWVLFYNTELFAEAGLPTEPEAVREEFPTWNEYMSAAETLEQATGAKMLTFSAENVGTMPGLRSQAGGGWYDDQGEFAFDQPANVETYELLVDLLDYAAPYELFSNRYWQAYTDGEVATLPGPAWLIWFFKNSVDAADKFRITTLPRFKEGGAFGANWGGVGAAIPFFKSEAEKRAAAEFAEFWHFSEEGVRAKLENGVPPAYDPGGDVWNLEDEYFGNQAIWQPVRESAEDSPPAYRLLNWDVYTSSTGVLKEVTEGSTSIQAVLDARQEEMLTQLDEGDKSVVVE